ncbi:Protein of unknown function [Desulfuromusa kysingii]|uniref:DUF3450 domain-containing protein n=2 Tax=Desulfuromusa kysingii TaxID=37625 RepID=A0A1H3VSR7_9BACT|nr:Protein of unknown function [Desulfuromusa kysingii]
MGKLRLLQRGVLFPLLCLLLMVSTVRAEKGVEELAFDVLRNQQAIQELTEEWSRDEKKMVAEIEQLRAQLNRLQVQSGQVEQALLVEEERIAQQRHRLVEAQKLRDGLHGWLLDVAQRCATGGEQSLPFLAGEREQRQADLEAVLQDPYTPLYEKFRRVFEVLLVETEYGYSNEVYRDNIVLEGRDVQVDLLRIGRTALFFRTPDGTESGYYDPSTQSYELFPDASVDLSAAFALVRRETAAKMVFLPVGRILVP